MPEEVPKLHGCSDNNINFPAFCNLHLQSDFALDIPGSRLDPLPRHFMYGTFPKYPLYYPLAGLMFSHPQFTHRLPSAIPGSNVSSVQPKGEKLYAEAPQRSNLPKHAVQDPVVLFLVGVFGSGGSGGDGSKCKLVKQ